MSLQWLDESSSPARIFVPPFINGASTISFSWVHWTEAGGEVFQNQGTLYREPQQQQFDQVPGRLKQVDIGQAFNSNIWGVNAQNEVFRFDWETQITVSKFQDGAVWGLSANNEIFALNGVTMRFAQMPGCLVKLAVGRAGSVWGLNAAHEIFWFNPATTRFQQMPGELASLSAGLDGFVMGINSR